MCYILVGGNIRVWEWREGRGRSKVLNVVGMLQNTWSPFFLLSLLYINSSLNLPSIFICKFPPIEAGT